MCSLIRFRLVSLFLTVETHCDDDAHKHSDDHGASQATICTGACSWLFMFRPQTLSYSWSIAGSQLHTSPLPVQTPPVQTPPVPVQTPPVETPPVDDTLPDSSVQLSASHVDVPGIIDLKEFRVSTLCVPCIQMDLHCAFLTGCPRSIYIS